MKKKNTILGIVTARGGSKGLPGKNIRPFHGKPMLAYTVDAAKQSGVLDRVILSTDSQDIAQVGRDAGAEVPFMRPAKLATDKTKTLPVLIHAVTWLREHEGYESDYVAILQPTTPLRQSWHLKEAVEALLEAHADSVLGVTPIPSHVHPDRAVVLNAQGHLTLLGGKPLAQKVGSRQEMKDMYYENGTLYIFKTQELFAKEPNFFGKRTVPYVMDEKYCIDIDTLEDFEAAEEQYNNL